MACRYLLTCCRLAVMLTALMMGASVMAASDDSSGRFDAVNEAIQRSDYDAAIRSLKELLRDSPRDADVLNMLGFTHRKSGNADAALDYYQQALAVEPKHRGANEYLGELYLEMGDLSAAQQRLSVLDSACFFGCREYDELKAAIASYKKSKGLQ